MAQQPEISSGQELPNVSYKTISSTKWIENINEKAIQAIKLISTASDNYTIISSDSATVSINEANEVVSRITRGMNDSNMSVQTVVFYGELPNEIRQ